MCGGAGGSARGKGADEEEGAGRHGALAPTSKGQRRKRWLPDIKGRAGDREGSGAPEVSPAGTVGKSGSGKVVGQPGPSWEGPRGRRRRVAEPHPWPPPAGGPLPWAGGSPGPGVSGGGRRDPRPGWESGQACPTAPSPGRGRGDKMAGGGGQGLPRPRRPLRSSPRPSPAALRAGATGR